MNDARSFHMTPDEFRQAGHELIEWIARYQERVESYPVLAQVQPGEIRAGLPAQPPEQGLPFQTSLTQVEELMMKGLTHWQSPNFFAYFPANSSGPAVLGDLLSSALAVQGMLWATSPAATEVETHVMDWMAQLFGLRPEYLSTSTGGGVIQDSASSSTLCAVLAARERATSGSINERGGTGALVGYGSAQAHSSLEKAFKAAGLGRQNLRLISCDSELAMDTTELERCIAQDRAAGLQPFFVMGNIGSTGTLAFDPLAQIGAIAQRESLWFHVDAAMAGSAMICPEFRPLQAGVELADSYVFDPHKWLFTNFDCSCFWVADRKALIEALTVLPEYLKNSATSSGAVIDYRDWHLPLGRRFRALKLWFVLNHYGAEGLRHHLRQHVALAQELSAWATADPRFEVTTPTRLNLVCLRLKAGDEATEALMKAVNATGEAYLSHTKVNGQYIIRVSVGQTHTERRHVKALWALIQRCLREGAAQ